MKTLLVPTDFSTTAKDAFRYAVRLAQRIGADIRVVNIYHEDPDECFSTHDVGIAASSDIHIKENLKKFALLDSNRHLIKIPDIKTECYECVGEVGEQIIRFSKSPEIDVVVMGMTGQNHHSEQWFGKVSSFVAQEAYCPVLLIPQGTKYRNPKRLLFAHNLEEAKQASTLERLAFMAKCFDAKVHNLMVDTDVNSDEKGNNLAKKEWHLFESERLLFKASISKKQNILETIHNYAHTNKIDMIVISTHHRPFLEKIFYESLTYKIALEAKLPVLILHLEDKFSMF